MQHRVRRTVGVVGDVVRIRPGKLVPRMKAGDLEDAFEFPALEETIGLAEKLIVGRKLPKCPGMDQQGGFTLCRFGRLELFEFLGKCTEHASVGACTADTVTDALVGEHRLGKRAEIQPNDGSLQPDAGLRDNLIVGHRIRRLDASWLGLSFHASALRQGSLATHRPDCKHSAALTPGLRFSIAGESNGHSPRVACRNKATGRHRRVS